MAVSYFVSYCGNIADPTPLYRYYARAHAPILKALPEIRSLVLHRPVEWRDPLPVNRGGMQLLAQMVFDSEIALDCALASEARARAREDFGRFPAFDGQVTHQAMVMEKIF